MAGLGFEILIDDKNLQSKLSASERRMIGFSRTIVKEASIAEDALKNIGAGAAGYFAFTELSSLPQKLIQVRGEFQSLGNAFEVMLKSKSKADALMTDVTRYAATTPFELTDVAGATKQLLAYGFASEDVIGTLRRLGDISSGLSIPLGELTSLYGKSKIEGRIMAEELNQFTDKGIPLIKLLAEQFGVAENQIRKLAEQGKIGFADVEQAINTLTDAGGTFAGLTEKNSKTLTGLYSNFEDSVIQAFNNIGAEQEGLLGESIKFATLTVENYEPILDILTVLVATWGTYKTAVIAASVAQSVAAGSGNIKAWLSLATTIRSAKDAQIAFNLATSANPYALAATALIALITSVALFSEETNEATKSQERAIAIADRFSQKQSEETTKVQILAAQIKDETRSREDRNKKLQQLIALSPQHFNALNLDNFATKQGTEAIKEYTKELEKKLKVQASEEQIVGNNKRIQQIRSGALDEEFQPNAFERTKLFLEDNTWFEEKKFKREVEKRKQMAIKALEDESAALLKVAAEGEQERANLKVDPPTPAPVKKKADKAAKEEKEANIKTFAEELEEKKQLYELHQRWITNFGQKAADEQFAELTSRNKSYVDYLNSKIDEITSANGSGKFSGEESKNLDLVIREKTEAKGGKSAIEQYKDKLLEAQDAATSLSERLAMLKQEQDRLTTQAPSNAGKEQIALVVEASNATKKLLKEELANYLVGVAGSEAKRLEIQKRYADLRAGLEVLFNGQRTEEYKAALDQMNQDEEQEFKEQKDRLHEQSKEFKALSKVISETGRDGIKIELGREQDELGNIANMYGAFSEQYKAQVEKIKILNKNLADEGIKNFSTWGMMVGVLAESLSEIPGAIGGIAQALAGITSGLNGFSAAMERTKDGKVTMEGYGAAIQATASLVNMAVSSARERKRAEEEYYQSVISQQSEYNLLLNEQLGLQADSSKSVFFTDYEKVISSGIEKMDDASERFEESLGNLANGKSKDGKKTGVDWSKVGAGAVSGATIGAVAGGGVFSWATTAIGAAGGAIAGLFAGMKKKDTFTPLLEAWPALLDQTKEGVEQFNYELAQTLIQNDLVDAATKQTLQTTSDWVDQIKEAKAQIKGVISDLAGALGNTLRDNLVNAFVEGTSAAEAFGASVTQILEKLLEQMLFAKVMGPALEQLEADMDASIGEGGDKNWIDDFGRFFQVQNVLGEQLFASMEDAKKEAEKFGLDLWDKSRANGGSMPAPMQGMITGASQESISILNGQMNAIRIANVEMVTISRNQLFELTAIKANTGMTARNTEELHAMRRSLDSIDRVLNSDWLRALGGG